MIMPSSKPNFATIDEYIAIFPSDVQKILEKVRKSINKAAPGATEAISYQIPAFKLDGKNLIHFAAFKNHVSIYPAPRGYDEFKDKIAAYKGGKGTVQFPLDQPIPYRLITRIVRFRVKKHKEKAEAKRMQQ